MTKYSNTLAVERSRWRQATHRGNRPFEIWDLLGVLLVASVAMIGLATGSQWGSQSSYTAHAWLGVGLGVGGVMSVVLSARIAGRRRRMPLGETITALVRAWTHPARDWMLFVLGCLVFIPVTAFHSSLLAFDSDSANLQSSIRFVQRHGPSYLVETQAVLLPHLVLGPLLLFGGTSAALALSIASVGALAGTISYLAWKLSRSALASLGAVLGLMAYRSILLRATLLPMYPAMLTFGFLGVYLAHRAVVSSGLRRWMYATFSGLSLILSMEAHQVGQLFLAVPVFLVVNAPLHVSVQGLWRVYAATALFFIPRAAINVMEGGLSHFLLNRVDYWVTEGHLLRIQERFLYYPSRHDFLGYLGDFATRVIKFMPTPLGFVVLLLAILGLFLARGRQRWFALLASTFVTAVALYQEVPPFSRYFSPQIVGSALAAGLTIGLLWRRRSALYRGVGAVAIAVLLIGGWINFGASLREHRTSVETIRAGPLPSIARQIDDGRGVIGARALQLAWVDSDIENYGTFFLTEDEFVTFLTWPNDFSVIEVLERHDIGWVLVNRDRALETTYNAVWIGPAYGLPVRHLEALKESRNFCLAMNRDGYLLYRLYQCD
jgi:hypothetical protein